MTKLLPIFAMEKILKNSGAKRVSLDAKKALKQEIESFAENISKRAVELSKHSKRRTVLAPDIKLASK
ncbi:histone [Candidatus Woesearchaeota archaeon]|nr:histone [Candidatus Woesearchaeota archaeon]